MGGMGMPDSTCSTSGPPNLCTLIALMVLGSGGGGGMDTLVTVGGAVRMGKTSIVRLWV